MSLGNCVETNEEKEECRSIEALAKSAALIAFHNFKWQYVTFVLLTSSISCGVSTFLQYYNNTAVVANENLVPRFSSNIRQFVLFGENLDKLNHLLKWLEFHGFDNTGKFLVICQSNVQVDCDEAEAVKLLWQFKIVNVIFISNKQDRPIGHTYEFGKDCKNSPPIEVRHLDSCIKGDSEYCGEKYPLKFHNLYGCPIIVSTFVQEPFMNINNGIPSGADGDLLRIILEALNASLVLMLSDGWGNLDKNGTWVGSLGDLYNDLANFSMTSASITQSRHKEFYMSMFYYSLVLGWMTHPPEIEMPYYKLLRPFKVDTQIAMAISCTVVVLTVFLLKTKIFLHVFRKLNLGQIPNKVLFRSWQSCMGQPIPVFRSKMVLSHFVLLWIWYCYLMRTFYQVHLINSLKNDIYLADFAKIDDAIADDYSFGGGSALKDYFLDHPSVYEKWTQLDSGEFPSITLNLTKGMRFVLALNLATAKFFIKEYDTKLHILPEKIIHCPTVLFFKKFSPLAAPINQILENLFEFGFPHMTYKNNTITYAKISKKKDKPIKLGNLAGCYGILFGGWLMSFLLLFIEIFTNLENWTIFD